MAEITSFFLTDFWATAQHGYKFFCIRLAPKGTLARPVKGNVLPSNNFIDDSLLLAGSAAEIYARGLYAFVSHQVGQQGYVVELLQKVFGEAVAEGVRIDHLCVQPVAFCVDFELLGNATCGDALPETV